MCSVVGVFGSKIQTVSTGHEHFIFSSFRANDLYEYRLACRARNVIKSHIHVPCRWLGWSEYSQPATRNILTSSGNRWIDTPIWME